MSREQKEQIRDGGTRVNVCPRIETQFRRGYVPYVDWTEVGVHPGLSNDNPATYAIDMFAEMHTLYNQSRSVRHREEVPPDITLREVLAAATVRGADNCGLAGVTGSISPGKAADLVIIDTANPLIDTDQQRVRVGGTGGSCRNGSGRHDRRALSSNATDSSSASTFPLCETGS